MIDDSSENSEVDSAVEAHKITKKTSYAYLVTIPFIILLIMADVMLIVKEKRKKE